MSYLKKIGRAFIYIFSIILILTFLFSLLNYFDIINNNITSIIKILIPIIALFVGGYIIGIRSKEKGWLEGIKLGIIISIIIMLFTYLGLHEKIILKDFVYYLIIIISTIFGSMFGISRNKES